MKKIIIATLITLGSFSMVSAEIGVNIGVTGSTGLIFAEGNETIETNKKGSSDVTNVFGHSSFFIEKTLGSRFRVGYDMVNSTLSSDTTEDSKTDNAATVTNTVKVDFSNINTLYAAVNITENLYVKAGMVSVDIDTKETLGTGGAYGNTSMDGTVMGLGYNKTFDNGFFIRAEGTITDYDDVKLSDTTNTKEIKITKVESVLAGLSIGKSF
ncbi:hypothetical protein [Candidatus Pelagibacter sp. Uisw_134_02]|uniref:hypothetical protein n=1 Tax=Candidatus Pelagibacter sp. Uisw_134_02 TaxID=3230990 RepID=UPI0039EB4DF6|tara:strand:+ start:254 stop:889 length:636 start_codon:yes stop_codon:yes gene_type:complete